MEYGGEAAERRIGRGFVPVIESGAEGRLAPDGADHSAEDGGHPQQRRKAFAESDAAKASENNQDDHSQGKANHHLGRSHFLRQIAKLSQGSTLQLYAKSSQQSGV